jgi:hypothetical protein
MKSSNIRKQNTPLVETLSYFSSTLTPPSQVSPPMPMWLENRNQQHQKKMIFLEKAIVFVQMKRKTNEQILKKSVEKVRKKEKSKQHSRGFELTSESNQQGPLRSTHKDVQTTF